MGRVWQVLLHPFSGSQSCKAERREEELIPEPLSRGTGSLSSLLQQDSLFLHDLGWVLQAASTAYSPATAHLLDLLGMC